MSFHPVSLAAPARSLPLVLALAVSAAAAPADSVDPAAVSIDGALTPERVMLAAPRPVARTASVAPGGVLPVAAGGGFVSVDDAPDGDLPRDLAFLPDGSAAVIANRDTDTLSFFDVPSKTVTAAVAVGDFPVDVAVTPNGQYALVPCVFSDAVFVVDVATKTVAAQVPVTGTQPFRVEVTADGALAVVGVINDGVASALSVIDLSTLTEVRSIPSAPQGVLGFFFTPESGTSGNLFTQFALSPDSRTVVLPDRTSATVFLYDAVVGAQTAAVSTAASPTSVDVAADGTIAVVGHEGTAQTVSVVDVPNRVLQNAFVVGSNLVNQVIRVTPNKSHALAAIQNALIFVDLATGAVATTISTGTVGDIEFTFDGAFAFVSNFNARVIDVASRTLVKTIPFAACVEAAASPTERRVVALNNRFREDVLLFDVNGAAAFAEGFHSSGPAEEGDAPRTLAMAPDGRRVLAANNVSRNGAIVDLDGRDTVAWPAAGDRPLGVAVSPDGTTGVIANGDEDTVTIVDMATGQSVAQLPVPTRPAEVLISPDSQWAYVTTIAGQDRLHFIQLAGAASQVVSSLVTGQMGSVIYTYNVLSGMALSPDGSVL
ncbi:MAG: YncE family protein, partial [Planctomycetota bacterium JB042]